MFLEFMADLPDDVVTRLGHDQHLVFSLDQIGEHGHAGFEVARGDVMRRGEHNPAGIESLLSGHIFLPNPLDRPLFSGHSLEPDCHPLGIAIPAVVGAARAAVDGAGRPVLGTENFCSHLKNPPMVEFRNRPDGL